MKTRLFFLNILFLILFAALLVRFFSLQVLSQDFYQNLAENQHLLSVMLNPLRGEVYIHDKKNGALIAAIVSIEKNIVFAVPPDIIDSAKTARILAPILEMTESAVMDRISDLDRKWVSIKKQLPESTTIQIEELDLAGIYLQPESHRFYVEGKFASQIFGFVGFQGDVRAGQYGIEKYFEEELAGSEGSLLLESGTTGSWIAGGYRNLIPARDGADIYLTLDRPIQFKAEEIISRVVEIHQADRGSILVMEARTGAILALAQAPSFDPNTFNETEDIAVFRNIAVSDPYEPGSVFKPITMAAALDAEAVEPDTTYEDTGSVTIGKYVIRNSDNKSYGTQSMTQVLEQSLNTGIIFVQNELGPEKFLSALNKFGFGKVSGIKLPAEAKGDISNLRGGGDIHYATAAFGQGITVTMLQLGQAYATIANEGRLTTPYIVEEIVHPDGRIDKFRPKKGEKVISSRAAVTLGAMLVSVVENGHGKQAGVPAYYVGGKTGTAQVASQEVGGYDPNVTIGTFAGFGPINDPKFVIVVRVDNPKTVSFAESTAAPAFGEMAQFLFNYFQIPPSR